MTNTRLDIHCLQGQKVKVNFVRSRKVLAAKASYLLPVMVINYLKSSLTTNYFSNYFVVVKQSS